MAKISYPVYEIIKVAVEIEKNGYKFYQEAAKLACNTTVAELFRGFAEEEIKHQDFFEGLAKLTPHKPAAESTPPDEYLAAIADATIHQQKMGIDAVAKKCITDRGALDIAVQVEKNAILYYTELLRFVSRKEKGMVEELVAEEKGHLTKLVSISKNIT